MSIIVLFHLPRAPWWPWSSPDLSTILANIFLYTEFMYKPVVSSVSVEPPMKSRCTWVLPVLYLIGKAYGVREFLRSGALAVVAGITKPTFRSPEVFSMPLFHCRSRGHFLAMEFAVTNSRLSAGHLTLVAAAGILVYGTSREYGFRGSVDSLFDDWAGGPRSGRTQLARSEQSIRADFALFLRRHLTHFACSMGSARPAGRITQPW